MASCEVTTYTPPPPPPVTTYTLELTQEEAEALVSVLARVGGCLDKSRRKHTSAILSSLGSVGVRFYDVLSSDVQGAITFEDQG